MFMQTSSAKIYICLPHITKMLAQYGPQLQQKTVHPSLDLCSNWIIFSI